MEKIKALITYKNWLLLNRGEIRPEVGDKIVISGLSGSGMYNKTVKKIIYIEYKSSFKIYITTKQYTFLEGCYVEIDYNPNESIEFGQFILDRDKNHFSVQELYKQFKN